MSEIVRNPALEVFERWGEAMKEAVGEENYASDNSITIAKTPYARLYMIGNPTGEQDLEANECSTIPSFQVEVFTSGQKAIAKAYEIDSASHQAMISMGFRRTYGPELIPNIDLRIKRCVSRYSRVLADGDTF